MTTYDKYIGAIAAALSTPHTPAQLRARLRVAGVLPSRIRSPAMHVAGGKRPREEDERIVADVMRTTRFGDLPPELVNEILVLLPRLGRVRLALASRRTLAIYRDTRRLYRERDAERRIITQNMVAESPVPLQVSFYYRVARMDMTHDDTLLLFPDNPRYEVPEIALDGTLVQFHKLWNGFEVDPISCAFAYNAYTDQIASIVTYGPSGLSSELRFYNLRAKKLVRGSFFLRSRDEYRAVTVASFVFNDLFVFDSKTHEMLRFSEDEFFNYGLPARAIDAISAGRQEPFFLDRNGDIFQNDAETNNLRIIHAYGTFSRATHIAADDWGHVVAAEKARLHVVYVGQTETRVVDIPGDYAGCHGVAVGRGGIIYALMETALDNREMHLVKVAGHTVTFTHPPPSAALVDGRSRLVDPARLRDSMIRAVTTTREYRSQGRRLGEEAVAAMRIDRDPMYYDQGLDMVATSPEFLHDALSSSGQPLSSFYRFPLQ